MEAAIGPSVQRRSPTSTWSRAQVAAMLEADDFSYQKIELPHGFSTSGRHDRSSTARRIFPDDLSGKSVLDVGCRLGYFCFEALKRGAERVVGVDIDPDNVRKARLLADCLGFEARFEQLDIDREPIRESFDTVLALNLLHHLANPIGTLAQLASIARERLVLEIAALRRTDRSKAGVPRVFGRLIERLPIIVVSPVAGDDPDSQKFFVTASAIDNLLRHPRYGFTRVERVSSRHKGRFIVIADKR